MTQALDKIEQIMETLENELETYDTVSVHKAEAEAAYRLAKAQAWYKGKSNATLKTVGDREAFVDELVQQEFYDFRVAEAKQDACKNRILSLRSLLSAAQTLASAGRV